MSPTPDQLRTEIETLEAELNEMSNGLHVGIGFFRDRVNQAISDIVGPKDALAIRFNGLQWTSGASPVRRRLDSFGGVPGTLSSADAESFAEAKQRTLEILQTLKWKLDRGNVVAGSEAVDAAKPSPTEQRIIEALEAHIPAAARCYQQALRDLGDAGRISFRGVANELRASVWEVLEQLAPDDAVMSADGFKLEPGRSMPTQKQKARFLLRSRLGETARKPPEATLELMEEHVATLTRGVYDRSSASSHIEAERGEVQQIKMYVDTLLAELLEIHQR